MLCAYSAAYALCEASQNIDLGTLSRISSCRRLLLAAGDSRARRGLENQVHPE